MALRLSSMLEDAERQAVIGDLAESRENGSRALANVLGLLVRREAAIWKDSHLWAVLLILLLPLSFVLCAIAQQGVGEGAVYTWMYANNWDWELLRNFGFWYELGHAATQLFLDWLAVACWSWSAGVLLGSYRKINQPEMTGALMLLLALFQIENAPQHWFHFWMVLSGIPPLPSLDPNAPVTAVPFYGVLFPFLVLGFLVALPATLGMRQQEMSTPRKLRIVLIFGSGVSVLTMLGRVPPGFGFLLGNYGRRWVAEAMPVLLLLAYWPALYMLVRFILKKSSATLA